MGKILGIDYGTVRVRFSNNRYAEHNRSKYGYACYK